MSDKFQQGFQKYISKIRKSNCLDEKGLEIEARYSGFIAGAKWQSRQPESELHARIKELKTQLEQDSKEIEVQEHCIIQREKRIAELETKLAKAARQPESEPDGYTADNLAEEVCDRLETILGRGIDGDGSPYSIAIDSVDFLVRAIKDSGLQFDDEDNTFRQQPESDPIGEIGLDPNGILEPQIYSDFDLTTLEVGTEFYTSPQPSAQVPEVTEYMLRAGLRAGRRALTASDEDIKECFLSMYDAYIAEKDE